MVEFALLAPVLVLIIALSVDLGRALYFEVTTTDAARDVAREAIGQPQGQKKGPGLAAICAAATADLKNVAGVACGTGGSPPAAPNQALVIVQCPDATATCSGAEGMSPSSGIVTVDVYYGFTPVLPAIAQLLPGGAIQLHNSAQMVTSW